MNIRNSAAVGTAGRDRAAYTGVMRSRATKRGAGVVVVRDLGGRREVLLLRAYRNWDLPKGGMEAAETPLQAAMREVREETGLHDLEFLWGEDTIDTEPYSGGKVVRFFVARSAGAQVSLPINPSLGRAEHHEYRWVTFDQAIALTVPRLRRVLQWALVRMDDTAA